VDHDNHFSKVISLIPNALYRHTDCEDHQPDDDGDDSGEEKAGGLQDRGDLPITNKYFQVSFLIAALTSSTLIPLSTKVIMSAIA